MRGWPLLVAAAAPLTACAYFNGIYNARQEQKHGDAMRRAGRGAAAESLYALAAQKSESVLVHHPRTHWAGEAELIAGWSWAMSGRCDRAEPRLASILERPGMAESRLERATLALGVCRARAGRYAEARDILMPLTLSLDGRVAREASVWAAFAGIALGQADSARAVMRGVRDSGSHWELVRALLEHGDLAAAESLLAERARRGDYRPDALPTLRALWNAGRREGVNEIIAAYDTTGASMEDRARLHVLGGELALTAGADSAARAHFEAALQLSADTALVREASVHLEAAELRTLSSLVDVHNVIARERARGGDTPLQRRLDANLLLVEMLNAHDDYSGAALFLAAEVARDSLGAPALASALLARVVSMPRSPLAAKALLAASRLQPDSANAFRARADSLVAGASYGEVADSSGQDGTPVRDPVEVLLARTWDRIVAQFADSLRRLRPDSAGPAAAPQPPAPPQPQVRPAAADGGRPW